MPGETGGAPRRILILGGTGEARELAGILAAGGCDVTTSLAGVTTDPAVPLGTVRIGGFGGELGLRQFIADRRFDAIADATHPFAARVSHHAAASAAALGIPYVRLERPPWGPIAGDDWMMVDTAAAAARVLPVSARILLTIGRKDIATFLNRPGISGVARMIEKPQGALPAGWRLVRARPPFSLYEEIALLVAESITHLVTKNSGGDATRAKIDAARETKIPVVMIARPSKPEAPMAATAQALARLLMP